MADSKTKRKSYATPAIKTGTDEAVFLGNPHIDNLMTVSIALGSEIWEIRQRMNVMETLMETKGSISNQMIEEYVPSDQQAELWAMQRQEMVDRVYSVLSRDTSGARPFEEEYEELQGGAS